MTMGREIWEGEGYVEVGGRRWLGAVECMVGGCVLKGRGSKGAQKVVFLCMYSHRAPLYRRNGPAQRSSPPARKTRDAPHLPPPLMPAALASCRVEPGVLDNAGSAAGSAEAAR